MVQGSIKQTIDENITTNKRLPGYGSWLQFICRLSTAPEKDMKMNHLAWCIERVSEEYKDQHTAPLIEALEAVVKQ